MAPESALIAKGRLKAHMGLLLNRAGALVTKNMEKAEVLGTFSQSLFVKTCPWEYQATEPSREALRELKKYLIREYLNKLDRQKVCVPNWMHS